MAPEMTSHACIEWSAQNVVHCPSVIDVVHRVESANRRSSMDGAQSVTIGVCIRLQRGDVGGVDVGERGD